MHKSFWCLSMGSTAGKLRDAIQQNRRRKNLSACIWWTESSVWKRRTGPQMLLCCRQDWTFALTYSVWQGKELWSKLGLGFCICIYWFFKPRPNKHVAVHIWMRNPGEWLIAILCYLPSWGNVEGWRQWMLISVSFLVWTSSALLVLLCLLTRPKENLCKLCPESPFFPKIWRSSIGEVWKEVQASIFFHSCSNWEEGKTRCKWIKACCAFLSLFYVK